MVVLAAQMSGARYGARNAIVLQYVEVDTALEMQA